LCDKTGLNQYGFYFKLGVLDLIGFFTPRRSFYENALFWEAMKPLEIHGPLHSDMNSREGWRSRIWFDMDGTLGGIAEKPNK
jgi:hypothetical protein